MKKISCILLIACLVGIIGILLVSCSKSKTPEAKPNGTNTSNGNVNASPDGNAQIPSGTELAKTLTPDILKSAHEIIPAYPNAELDTTKGNYSSTARGNNYNIIYHTTDPFDKVIEFFMKNIPDEYRKENPSPKDAPRKWITINFGSPSFSQNGTVTLYEMDDKKTEIIYYILQPSSIAPGK